jgi:hypothetical protein
VLLAKTKSDRYSLPQSDKGMLANDCSPDEGSGIYSISAGRSAYIDAMIIINCEDINTDDPLIAAGSKFHH